MEVCRPASYCLKGAACTFWCGERVHASRRHREHGIGHGKKIHPHAHPRHNQRTHMQASFLFQGQQYHHLHRHHHH